jgi:glycosyltransferase involved in cell wall biosynthesis
MISIIIPTFRQEKTISENILSIENAIKTLTSEYEIIIVVDGIIDKTFANAKRVKSSKIKIFGYKYNYGKGYALRFGVARSKGDIIIFIDGGTEISPVSIEMLHAHFQWYKADIIVGSKWHPVSILSYPWWRRIVSKTYGLLVRILFRLKIKDTQLGLKVFRRKVLEDVLPRLLVKQYAIDIEILAVANYLGYKRIYEAPVQLVWNEKESTVSKNFIYSVYSTFKDTLAVFYRMYIVRYYDDKHNRKWRYDPDLNYKVNTG